MVAIDQVEANKAVIRSYIDECVNKHDVDKLGDYMIENGIDHSAPPGLPQGLAGARMFLGMMWAAFPDVLYTIEDLVGEDDLVTIRATYTGSWQGAFMGKQPTGRSFRVEGIETLRLKDGKYVEHWGGIDLVGLMSQIGFYEDVQAAQQSEAIRELGRKYIEAINEDDFELLAQILDENFVDQAAVGTNMPQGLEGAKAAHLMLREGFPDVRFEIDELLVEGNKLVMRATGYGTNTGSFFGMPPTGKEVSWVGLRILRVENGKFVEGVAEFDQVGILQQMGIVPSLAPPPDLEANKEIIRRLYDEENKGNIDAIDDYMASDIVIWGDALAPYQKGTAGIKEQVKMVRQAFPDLTVTLEDLVAEGDKVTARIRWRGHFTQGFMDIPATGKECTWTAIAINRIENGKVAERWFVASTFSLLQQLGIIPDMSGGDGQGAGAPAAAGSATG
jgi:predicted ester cyclase